VVEGGGDGAPEGDPPARKRPEDAGGKRLSSIEGETARADERLRRLETSSGELRVSVDALAEATGELRRQSAAMREAALRVAEAVELAKRKRAKGAGGAQDAGRPPRTK
jgi:hypothetical protein